VTPDEVGVEIFDRWVTLDLSARSTDIMGYHWDSFDEVLSGMEDRAERRSAQETITIDGERERVESLDDEALDALAYDEGEVLRDAMVSVIESEGLIKTGEFLEDVSTADVTVEER
jgi:hypothetical protein